MNELDPEHPVHRFRFVTRGAPAAAPSLPRQDEAPSASKTSRRDGNMDRADLDAARRAAGEVGDERLRESILASLRVVADRPPRDPAAGPPVNPKK